MNHRARTAWGAYKVIAETLRRRIQCGEYEPGVLIPSEADLAAEFGVARTTMRRALAILQDDGLITSTRSIGRCVRTAHSMASAPRPRYQRIADELHLCIRSGVLKPGDPLPSESELARQNDVSRATARQALQVLEGIGVAQTVPGKGRIVRPDVPSQPLTVRARPSRSS